MRLLTLPTRRSRRLCAAWFLAVYAAFASGAAFGVLDLACLPAPSGTCGQEPVPACGEADQCTVCGMLHTPGMKCCCHEVHTAPTSRFSFTQAARCANPDADSATGMTRVTPHVAGAGAPEAGLAPAEPVAERSCVLRSRPIPPSEKVPLAA